MWGNRKYFRKKCPVTNGKILGVDLSHFPVPITEGTIGRGKSLKKLLRRKAVSVFGFRSKYIPPNCPCSEAGLWKVIGSWGCYAPLKSSWLKELLEGGAWLEAFIVG